MKLSFLTLLLLLFSFSIPAQQTVSNKNTLENQFDEIFKKSSNYKTYKVINKLGFKKLKNNVLDSLNANKKILSEKKNLLKVKENIIYNLSEKVNKLQFGIDSSIKQENYINLYGLELKKTSYTIILWLLIFIFLLGLLFFIYKFFKSNILTKEAKNNLIEVEEELQLHKKKSLEREQKLRRQLQDEINKQKKS